MSRHSTQLEVEVVVEYDYHGPDDGGRDYPSTPAYVEIYSVQIMGVEVTLSDADMERIQQEIEDAITEREEQDERYERSEVIQEDCE